MNIANIGAFAGGLQRGAVIAGEEQRAEEDQLFERERQKAWRDEQARQERIRQGIAGIARPGAELSRTPFVTEGIDGPENIPGLYNAKYQTEGGYARQLADVYQREGDVEGAMRMGEYGFQQGQRARTLKQQEAGDAVLSRRAEMIKEMEADPGAFATKYGVDFNADRIGGPRFKGHTVAYASTPQGQVGYLLGPDGSVGGKFNVDKETLRGIIDQMTDAELGATSPEQYAASVSRGLQRRQVGVAEEGNVVQRERTGVLRDHYAAEYAKPKIMEVNGQAMVFGSDGRLLGTYGQRRADPGAFRNDPNDKWLPFGADKDGTPILYNSAKLDPKNPQGAFTRMDGKPIADFQRVYKKLTGESQQVGLKWTKVGNDGDGYFTAEEGGPPMARRDSLGEFPMIPFGVDPRSTEEWKSVGKKLEKSGGGLIVTRGPSGSVQWAYQSGDGRMWSTPQEALNPPREGVKLTPDAARRVAAGEAGSVGGTATARTPSPNISGDKTQGLPGRVQDPGAALFEQETRDIEQGRRPGGYSKEARAWNERRASQREEQRAAVSRAELEAEKARALARARASTVGLQR